MVCQQIFTDHHLCDSAIESTVNKTKSSLNVLTLKDVLDYSFQQENFWNCFLFCKWGNRYREGPRSCKATNWSGDLWIYCIMQTFGAGIFPEDKWAAPTKESTVMNDSWRISFPHILHIPNRLLVEPDNTFQIFPMVLPCWPYPLRMSAHGVPVASPS